MKYYIQILLEPTQSFYAVEAGDFNVSANSWKLFLHYFLAWEMGFVVPPPPPFLKSNTMRTGALPYEY
jgi:hypothetical protein